MGILRSFDTVDRWSKRKKTDEERTVYIRDLLGDYERLVELSPQVLKDFDNGILDISYVDSEGVGHLLSMQEDEEFLEYKDQLEKEWNVTVFHGIKDDNEQSPIFLSVSESEYVNSCGYIKSREGIELALFYWIDGESYSDIYFVDTVDGVFKITGYDDSYLDFE